MIEETTDEATTGEIIVMIKRVIAATTTGIATEKSESQRVMTWPRIHIFRRKT